VVDLKTSGYATVLATPFVACEDFAGELAVGFGFKP
jgi:hypothetical protein